MRRAAVWLVAALALVGAACSSTADEPASVGSSGTDAPPGPAPGLAPGAPAGPGTTLERPVSFTTFTETYVDTSRVTEAGSATPALPERTLPTTIRLPDGDDAVPLVVFSHGLIGHPRVFSELFDAWAAAGYAVAAPAFPLTNRDVPGGVANWSGLAQQPADVSFVLDQLLAANADPASPLDGRVDESRIGAAGLSLGGATTYGVLFNDCCRDERFSSGMILAGATLPVSGAALRLDGHVPLLIAHGDADPSLPYALAHDTTFVEADPPVWFVTLLGGGHAAPFEDAVTPYDETVERFTTTWWDATLLELPGAVEQFEADAAVDGLTVLEVKR